MILGGGGEGQIGPPGFWLTHPPTHPHQKIFPQEKDEIYQRGPNLEVDFRYTNFFWPLTHPPTHPPPRYSINQPLSKGLHTIPQASLVRGGGGGRNILCLKDSPASLPWPCIEGIPGHDGQLRAQQGPSHHPAGVAAPK